MENTMMEMNLEQMEQISGGVSPSFFERGKTKEEQIMFVYQNFVLEKQMRLTYSFDSCESIGYIKGNAVVLFACREFFIIISMKMFPTAGGLQHE